MSLSTAILTTLCIAFSDPRYPTKYRDFYRYTPRTLFRKSRDVLLYVLDRSFLKSGSKASFKCCQYLRLSRQHSNRLSHRMVVTERQRRSPGICTSVARLVLLPTGVLCGFRMARMMLEQENRCTFRISASGLHVRQTCINESTYLCSGTYLRSTLTSWNVQLTQPQSAFQK